MKKKILLYYFILIFIGITITGFFVSRLTEKFYMSEIEQQLQNTIKLIQYQISDNTSKGIEINYNTLAKTYGKILSSSIPIQNGNIKMHIRVTFIDFDGVVIGESDQDYEQMENHGDRKEIIEAINGKIGKDTRFSRTLKTDFFYIAVPLSSSDIVMRISFPLVQLNKIDRIIWLYSLAGIGAGLILTTLLAFRFSSLITYPIKQIISAAKEIALGNYYKRVKVYSSDELGELGQTFNRMAVELEKTVLDLTDKNVKVNSIINSMAEGIAAVDTNYKIVLINPVACKLFEIENASDVMGKNVVEVIRNNQINTLLNESIEKNTPRFDEIVIGCAQNKVLRTYVTPIKPEKTSTWNSGAIITVQDITNIKRLEKIRTEFVSNVTHELKTPLTSIRGFVETLREGALNDKDVAQRFLEIIDIEADRLYVLINDILELSQIESNDEDSNIQQYSLKLILNEVLPILQKTAEKKDVTLVDKVSEEIMIVANKNRIKQMLINLIDNGIKYNKKNGKVFISAFKAQGKIIIKIKDTGIGISEEHLPRIFERFYRVDKGRSRSMGGTGLGLSIVKHIVNLYNGNIKVSSQPGLGTEFTVQLPH